MVSAKKHRDRYSEKERQRRVWRRACGQPAQPPTILAIPPSHPPQPFTIFRPPWPRILRYYLLLSVSALVAWFNEWKESETFPTRMVLRFRARGIDTIDRRADELTTIEIDRQETVLDWANWVSIMDALRLTMEHFNFESQDSTYMQMFCAKFLEEWIY